jgi:hypothetical protein
MFFYRNKTTPMLNAWVKEADEMGLPENIRKGLIFLIAFGMRSRYPSEDKTEFLKHAQKLSYKISLKAPHLPEGEGGNFYDAKIAPLLAELAGRSLVSFSPRRIEMPSGESILTWSRGPQDLLPPCLRPDTSLLSEWEEILTSLCSQIGDLIEDDLEDAYLDGFLFFDSYLGGDVKGTMQISQLAASILPPHFQWFDRCLNFSPEMLAQGNPVQKVLDCFLWSPEPLVYPLVQRFSDALHYCGPRQKRTEIWEASIKGYSFMAGIAQMGIGHDAREPWFSDAKKMLLEENFEIPPVCSSAEELVILLQNQIHKRWGYDIFSDQPCRSPGEEYTRRACITVQCVANGILQPLWNDFAKMV